jgi:hypothetical protein
MHLPWRIVPDLKQEFEVSTALSTVVLELRVMAMVTAVLDHWRAGRNSQDGQRGNRGDKQVFHRVNLRDLGPHATDWYGQCEIG